MQINISLVESLLPMCVCIASFSLLSPSSAHLPLRPHAQSMMLRFKTSCHLVRHCKCVRPGTSAAIVAQFLPPYVSTASFSLLSSSAVHLPVRPFVPSMLGFKKSCHLVQHCCFVRPETNAAIAAQFLPPCVCTAFFSLLSSPSAHLPVRPFARSMLASKPSCHLRQH
jgi:hypothetical protein